MDLHSQVDTVRIKAVGIVIKNNIKEALSIIEEDFEQQDISFMPLYLEALKRLGSARLEEKIDFYLGKIQANSVLRGEKFEETVKSKIRYELMKEKSIK